MLSQQVVLTHMTACLQSIVCPVVRRELCLRPVFNAQFALLWETCVCSKRPVPVPVLQPCLACMHACIRQTDLLKCTQHTCLRWVGAAQTSRQQNAAGCACNLIACLFCASGILHRCSVGRSIVSCEGRAVARWCIWDSQLSFTMIPFVSLLRNEKFFHTVTLSVITCSATAR